MAIYINIGDPKVKKDVYIKNNRTAFLLILRNNAKRVHTPKEYVSNLFLIQYCNYLII